MSNSASMETSVVLHEHSESNVSQKSNASNSHGPLSGSLQTVHSAHHSRQSSLQGASVVTGSKITEGPQRIVREYSNVTENIVRKTRLVEETIDKVIVVPETFTREEEYDEVEYVKENIIEVARPQIREVYVDVPQYEHREEIIEVEERRIVEKIVPVEKVEYQEVINYVPRIEQRERIVEFEEIEYVEVEVEKVIEIPEYREEIIIKEKSVPRYIDKLIHKNVDVEVEAEIERAIPVPVEHIIEQEFNLPTLVPRYTRMRVPVYVPRFVEVPVPAEALTAASLQAAEELLASIEKVCSNDFPSLCEMEELAAEAKNFKLDIEEDGNLRFNRLADQMDTNAVEMVDESGHSLTGRKISVSITHN